MSEIVDLSQEIYPGMQVYPGHLETVIWEHHSHAGTAHLYEGEFSYASRGIMLCDHGPTHVDALSHLDPRPEAASIEKMRLSTFFGPGVCIDVSHVAPREYITAEDLDAAVDKSKADLRPGSVVLMRTGTFDRVGGTTDYTTQYPGLDEGASQWLVELQVKAFGVDSPSPDNPASRTYPVHLMCREHGITHYENLQNLDAVLDRPFTFAGFPLRIRNGTGSPVRAVAIIENGAA